ncbi:MAG: hypothetical protein ACFE9Z_08285 [Promethearchaeota archaeon]
MEDSDNFNDDLEEQLDKAFTANENKKDVFSIIQKEKESLKRKENRIKFKFRSKS